MEEEAFSETRNPPQTLNTTPRKRGVVSGAASFAVVAVVAFGVGFTLGAKGGEPALSHLPFIGDGLNATPDSRADLTDFWKAWNALEERFVETHASTTIPTPRERVWGAIEGLARSYGDPYTIFFPPEDAKVFESNVEGNFEGVGMEIDVRNNILTVIAPLKNTPAARAGILAGDQIVAIDKKPTDGLSTDQAVKLIRGPKGSTVTFMIVRNGKILTIPVVRDTIQIPTIETENKDGVFLISIYNFSSQTSRLFSNALAEFASSGASKLLLDLRGNPGGYLESSVEMASYFLPEGAVIVTEDYDGKSENKVHRSYGYGKLDPSVRVAILIDRGSASASEIFAGALRDHDIATLIGESSFGKGSVQELIDVGDASLKVTVARWVTPSGQWISGEGLAPDIKVDRTPEDIGALKDPQKDRAIEFLKTGK